MNVLYIAFKDFSNFHFGANKKVVNECKALERMGHTVTLVGRYHSDIVKIATDGSMEAIKKYAPQKVDVINKVMDKKHQLAQLRKAVEGQHYDLCYIRYDLSTADFVKTLKALKQACDKIVIEIPTYPYKKEYAHTKFAKTRMLLDDFWGKKLKNYVDAAISFYEVENNSFFGIPVVLVPNGFDFSESKIITDTTVPEDIHIAAVSSMREWHGYERFIEGMNDYYANGGNRNIFLHLVGKGAEYGKYKSLVEKYSLQDRVIMHGPMHGQELDSLLEKCTLGIDSLARHRSGISVLSSLKSREYGAKGIPLINSCKVDIIDDGYPYCLYTTADETNIPMEDIIAFYDRIYSAGNRAQVAAEVREYIESRSDMNAVMKQITDSIF